MMNTLESYIYNLVRKNPKVKQIIRDIYQDFFDLLPKRKEFFYNPYLFLENFYFGFHDVSPFSNDESKLLVNHNTFDFRMPQIGEEIELGYFDFINNQFTDYHILGKSSAWNYHKGCRLQWIDSDRVIYNTAINSKLLSKILNTKTGEELIVNSPIDSVFCNQEQLLATSFSYERLERCMPGYGYSYKDNGKLDEAAPCDTGLFLVDILKNTSKLIVPLSQLADTVDSCYLTGFLHFVTHTEFSKDGRYIAFLYRRIPKEGDYMKRYTKIMVYDLKYNNLIELPTQESGSHYVWNSQNQLLASCIIDGKSCHVLYDMNDIRNYRIIAGDILNSDGHQSFITDTSFVTDTYPDKYRMAKIYKVNVETQNVELLVNVYSPKKFQTKNFKCHIACDLHPRVSPSGKYICFDSPRTGKRGLYVMPLK